MDEDAILSALDEVLWNKGAKDTFEWYEKLYKVLKRWESWGYVKVLQWRNAADMLALFVEATVREALRRVREREGEWMVFEGILHLIPYRGDGMIVYPALPPEDTVSEKFWEFVRRIEREVKRGRGLDLFALLASLEGRYLRVEVGKREIRIKLVGKGKIGGTR